MSTAPEQTPSRTGTSGGVDHLVCYVCEPELYPGMRALCGAELLGIDAVWGDVCRVCDELTQDHYRDIHPALWGGV